MKIIAEIGSNWTTFDHAKDSIAQAKAAGADTVKFQAYDWPAMFGVPIQKDDPVIVAQLKAEGASVYTSYGDRIEKSFLPLDWLPKLAEKAKACGIEFMATAFSPELVEAVDLYVQVHKVASAELTHLRLLQAIAKTGKPVYLSTGASGLADIKNALDVLRPGTVTLMHCVAAYPARATSLSRIKALKDHFGLPVGFSDHSISCDDIPEAAMRWGATVLEKHVNFAGVSSPDSEHSLTGAQFKYMVDYLKGKVPALAPCHDEEREMISKHNRRLIATRDIAVGEKLKEGENFGIYRSLKDDHSALSPWAIDDVNGKLAKRAMRAGDGITPDSI